MSVKELLSEVARAKKIAIFGAGKMGQQVAACLRNILGEDAPIVFLTSSGDQIAISDTPVIGISQGGIDRSYFIIIAAGRAHHSDIEEKVKPRGVPYTVLSQETLEKLKVTAFDCFMRRTSRDFGLSRAMTNDLASTYLMFADEGYSGSIRRKMNEIALETSAQFAIDNLTKATVFSETWSYRQWLIGLTPESGVFFEFGVADGNTIDFFARHRPRAEFFGFDSFEGLPEHWKSGFEQGRFTQSKLPIVAPNVSLIKGWFDETIPKFKKNAPDFSLKTAFIHIDCDLYSSTKTVLSGMAEYLAPGSIIAFDEYLNYPGWEQHEHRAFAEFVQTHQINFEYIGYVENGCQVAVRIISIGGDLA
jgi:hypothetical protein